MRERGVGGIFPLRFVVLMPLSPTYPKSGIAMKNCERCHFFEQRSADGYGVCHLQSADKVVWLESRLRHAGDWCRGFHLRVLHLPLSHG